MKYDVSMHLPAQIEGMMNSFQKADIASLERSLSNIINLIKDEKFHRDIKDYQKKRMEKIEELSKKALDATKTIKESKSFSELYVDIDEIKNDLVSSIEVVELDYWDHIKEYITLYINKEENEKDTEDTE